MSTDETITVDGEERPVSDLTFISLAGPGLVVQHTARAEEQLTGTGMVPPDPIEFGESKEYTPKNATEANELLHHPHNAEVEGNQDLFVLFDEEEDATPPPQDEEVPDGYAKVNGEVIPIEEAVQQMGGTSENGTADSSGEGADDPSTDLTPLTAPEGEKITTKQDALEALAAEGVPFGDDAPRPHDAKDEIIAFAHQNGYRFPNYE